MQTRAYFASEILILLIMTKTFHQVSFNHDIINDSFLTFNFSNCQLVIIYHSILFYFIHVKSHVICNTSRSINMLEISISEKIKK